MGSGQIGEPLLADQIAREVLYQNRYNASMRDVEVLIAALRGIASCGTACGCCRMHNEIATEAVRAWEKNLREG